MEEIDVLEDVTFIEEPSVVDFKRLVELTSCTEKGSYQLSYLVKKWEWKQENAIRLLREELENLRRQKNDVELKKTEHHFEDQSYEGSTNSDTDIVKYWKKRALHSEKLLEESVQREQILLEKLEESIENPEKKSSPVEELSQILKRADNFLHFVLQNSPVLIGHQDKELRHRFIYNHFPSMEEEDIIGKTDDEIFKGGGVKECQDFKREVLERGIPAKREITFKTELFGAKTFLMYVEPVFNKVGDKIGVNYTGMEITDQVKKREKMAKLREEIAVQKFKENELTKTIHITEETTRAKQMLVTMLGVIKSPLSEIVSTAEILSATKLDKDQKQLVNVILSFGDIVLHRTNDILDYFSVESGVMKLEATKFRPREVIKHVLQTAAASLKNMLTLEGHVTENVPVEVIGDVKRIQQIITNLIRNAIKFTEEGKVSVNLYAVADPCLEDDLKPTMDTYESVVWIRWDVQDTGVGIPESKLPLLFNAKDRGTGLSLVICKQLVEIMGGHLTVSSKEHNGSIFTFVLPYKLPYTLDETIDMDNNGSTRDDISCNVFHFKPSNGLCVGLFKKTTKQNRRERVNA